MFWYLATPYTKYHAGLQMAYSHACAHAAWLIARGVPVFSPIAHTHGIAEMSQVDAKDGAYWLAADEPIMNSAYGLIVCKMKGWEESSGVQHEIDYFHKAGKPIVYLAENAEELPPLLSQEHTKQSEDVLEEALRITSGDRQANYGPPNQDFARTAAMWNALFGWDVTPSKVAMAMIALKLSRETHQKRRDNSVDIAGYARCLHVCNEAAKK